MVLIVVDWLVIRARSPQEPATAKLICFSCHCYGKAYCPRKAIQGQARSPSTKLPKPLCQRPLFFALQSSVFWTFGKHRIPQLRLLSGYKSSGNQLERVLLLCLLWLLFSVILIISLLLQCKGLLLRPTLPSRYVKGFHFSHHIGCIRTYLSSRNGIQTQVEASAVLRAFQRNLSCAGMRGHQKGSESQICKSFRFTCHRISVNFRYRISFSAKS